MKAKHYYAFDKRIQDKLQGGRLNEENWSLLRMDQQEGAFSIEKSVESYERNCMNAGSYKVAALKICEFLKVLDKGYNKIISLGVGKGILEWHLKRINPDIVIECTDYTEKSIIQLRQVFRGLDNAYQFDMLKGDYRKLDKDAIFVMYRVAAEFSLEEWHRIFLKMHVAEISHIIFVPERLNNLCSMIKEQRNHIKNILRGRKDTQCGWLYSESEYMKMFRGKRKDKPLYAVEDKVYFDRTAAFLLKRVE